MEKQGVAGNHGNGVKSDCRIQFEVLQKGGIQIELISKVKSLYGKSIIELAQEIISFYNIKNAKLIIEDSGAVEFVLAARIEAAIKKVINTDKEFLLPLINENQNSTQKDQLRFSRLYLPGNSPKLMINAGLHKPNGLILDLEDAVAPSKKYEARFLVRNALRSLNFYGAERMVRINQLPDGLNDLEFVIPHCVNLVLVPKCESDDDLIQVNNKIDELKKKHKVNNDVWLMPIIESAKGVMNAYKIAEAANNVAAIAIGLEDYTADIGTSRTFAGNESFFARSMIVTAAIAAGIQPIDSVFSDISDLEGLAENVRTSKSLGFVGMGCIHPRQIAIIHENFAPLDKEIEKAKKIVLAFNDAKEKGLGVVSLGSKMIDAPVVLRAQNTINLAIDTGKLNEDWPNN
jgi:citrate lyase subunit beta/citryl-CoA lyase|tara:strand:+ start:624 stop:1832 length:1209 start_codon:yes stop_codon:yes gene_type:complete